ncbi:MAG: FAD-dependent oxidoreductase [Patescibacteria group bacterium]|nr:FAD-dependent oxidoreductase [Patescibacteria group bacterium]
MENFDLLILGSGPAGLTAALYALRYNLTVGIIGGIPGGLMMESHKICNWPGENEVVGYELANKMKEQVKQQGAKFIFDFVEEILPDNEAWIVKTKAGKEFKSKFVIYALGTQHKHLGLAAEDKFIGKGVAYCATCDAMFYKGKITAVIGGGNSAMTAALYLADICPKVYLINKRADLKGDIVWLNKVKEKENIVYIPNNNVIDLTGEEKLEKIILQTEFLGQTEINVDGLFIEIGLEPNTVLFKTIGGELDEKNHIKVAQDMSTNLKNIFAAGDVTNGSNNFRQVLTAAAEGAIAADSVFKEFSKR